jgi:hypothetical protein
MKVMEVMEMLRIIMVTNRNHKTLILKVYKETLTMLMSITSFMMRIITQSCPIRITVV